MKIINKSNDKLLKHKSKIKGKEESKTEFYYESTLKDCFTESDDLKFTINPKKLFDKAGDKNNQLLQQFLPALTTWERIAKAMDVKSNKV